MFLRLINLAKKRGELFLVLLIIALSSFLRLYRIGDYMTFLGDEGRDAIIVKEILEGNLTLLGPRASAGDFFLGPIYYYLMAPFLFIFKLNPVGPSIMVALFGIATVYLVYKIGKEFFGLKAALIAAALYAVSPLVIAYSRSSWNPNPMPFFSILTLYFLYKGVVFRKIIYLFLSGFFLGIAMQLHYLSTFLVVILFVYVLLTQIFEKGWGRKFKFLVINYSLILAGFVVGWSPFLAFEIRHGFPNINTIIRFIFSSSEVVTGKGDFKDIVSDVFFRLFGRLTTTFPAPEHVLANPNLGTSILYWVTLALAYLSIIALLYKLFTSKKEKFSQVLLVTVWFSLGIILFGFYKKSIYDYYLAFLFPVPFLLIGNLLSLFPKVLPKKFKLLGLLSIVVFAILFFMNIKANPFKYEPNRQYNQVKMISEFVLEKAGSKPFNFALITGGNSDHAYRYFFELEKKKPVTILSPQVDPERKSVTDQLLIVCEENPCYPLGHSLWEIAGFGRSEVVGEWNVSVLKVYKLIHYKEQ